METWLHRWTEAAVQQRQQRHQAEDNWTLPIRIRALRRQRRQRRPRRPWRASPRLRLRLRRSRAPCTLLFRVPFKVPSRQFLLPLPFRDPFKAPNQLHLRPSAVIPVPPGSLTTSRDPPPLRPIIPPGASFLPSFKKSCLRFHRDAI